MVSPGPVVITATFVGGFAGSLAAPVGIFLPSIIFTAVGTPLLIRYGKNVRVAGFVRGVTVAVIGVLAGTTYLVGKPVVGDWLTALIVATVLLAPHLQKPSRIKPSPAPEPLSDLKRTHYCGQPGCPSNDKPFRNTCT